MRRSLANFIRDESGATALEYSLIAIMISILVIGGASSIGTRLSALHFGPLLGAFN